MIKTPLSTVIGGAFWTPGCTVIGGNTQTFDQLIKKLFSNNEQGFFYDPNDLSTMYQDAAGTIPVTDAGQPVGLVLDKSKGLVLGQDLITPLDFNTWGNSGALSSKTTTSFTTTGIGGVIKLIGIGKTVRINLVGNTTATLRIRNGVTADGDFYINPGSFNVIFNNPALLSANGNLLLQLQAAGTVTFTILSVKELAGNHAYQTTSASRPILRQNAVTGANYLEFDGTDDFLHTSNIDFTSMDKVSLFAGVRKLTDANVGTIAEFSGNANSNTGSFWLLTPLSAGANTVSFASRGSATTVASIAALSALTSAVLRGVGDISGDNASTYVNGKLGDKRNTDQGTGNYGNYPLYIGRRAGTSLPFNGYIYSLIGIGRLTTDNETIALEKAIAKNAGVTLNV